MTINKCNHCGSRNTARAGITNSGSRMIFCTDCNRKCVPKVKKTCKQCGNLFLGSKRKVYCKNKCNWAAWKNKNKKLIEERRHKKEKEKRIKTSVLGKDKKVIIDGNIYYYQIKAPFSKSGESISGALEYDVSNDLIKCHECGGWFRQLGQHINNIHNINAKTYKNKHGLKLKSALISEGTRKKLIDLGVSNGAKSLIKYKLDNPNWKEKSKTSKNRISIEKYNKSGNCPAQILEKIKNLHNLIGRVPTLNELREHGISINAAANIFGSIKQAVKLTGLSPRGKHARRYSNEQLLELLRIFYRNNARPAFKSDCKRGILPNIGTYQTRFGGIVKAWAKAGLPPSIFMKERYPNLFQ